MPVKQSGTKNAKIMLVIDHPVKAGMNPYEGGLGGMLTHSMSRAGVKAYQCFATHVVHEYPTLGVMDAFAKKEPLKFAASIGQLIKDINEVNPNVIVAMGESSMQILTGKRELDKWRGSVLESSKLFEKNGVPRKVIPTYCMMDAVKLYEKKTIIEWDFLRVAREAEYPEIVRVEREYILNPDPVTAARVAQEMMTARAMTIDIECVENATTGKWDFSCCGFADSPRRTMVLPWNNETNKALIKMLCESDVPKIYQNGMFDTLVLENDVGIKCKNFHWDTMFGQHVLLIECAAGGDEMSHLAGKKRTQVFRKGLGFIASIYANEPYYKDDGKVGMEGGGDIGDFWLYNGRDCCVTYEIYETQLNELAQLNLLPTMQHEVSLAEPLVAMTKRGIRVDVEQRKKLDEFYKEEIAKLQDELDTFAKKPVNVSSTKDVQELLYETLGLPPQIKYKTGKVTADKTAIHTLAGKHDHPMLHTVLRIREYRKFVETFVNAKIDDDGRIRCSFDVTGTRSGRLSSRASIYGSGTNLQTIPTRNKQGELIRGIFIADPGKILIYRDFSQAEARVVAYLARCPGLIELFEDPTRDVHKENAVRIFNKHLDLINEYPERYLAKRVIHASNYGTSGGRLAQVVNEDAKTTGVRLSLNEADALIMKYFLLYPELKENFWREVCEQVRDTHVLINPFGRRREFFGRIDYMAGYRNPDEFYREVISWIPQSAVGDLCNMALVRMYNEIELARPEWGAELLLQVHDSILMQVDDEYLNVCNSAMEECMMIPMTIHGKTFTIPTDSKVGTRWCSHKTMPGGLMDYHKYKELKAA